MRACLLRITLITIRLQSGHSDNHTTQTTVLSIDNMNECVRKFRDIE